MKLILLFVKYSPVILSIATAIKLLLLGTLDTYEYTSNEQYVKYINALLSIFMNIGVLSLSIRLKFCWKHRLLCYLSILGCLGYIVCLYLQIDKDFLINLIIPYLVSILIICIKCL